jgi:hypothetical protein
MTCRAWNGRPTTPHDVLSLLQWELRKDACHCRRTSYITQTNKQFLVESSRLKVSIRMYLCPRWVTIPFHYLYIWINYIPCALMMYAPMLSPHSLHDYSSSLSLYPHLSNEITKLTILYGFFSTVLTSTYLSFFY